MEAFVDLLRVGGASLVIDVRTVRRSRRNPQYDGDALPAALKPFGIDYRAIPELGGLRKRSTDTPPSANAYWTNESFHNYADHALTETFRAGIDALIEAGRGERCAIMCAEAVWWRCHRRIIADHLILRGEKVFHLMDKHRVEEAVMTPGAKALGPGLLRYPRAGD
jgi:uncharacterized protein (DUF488 family)